jgi:hypothetical protein
MVIRSPTLRWCSESTRNAKLVPASLVQTSVFAPISSTISTSTSRENAHSDASSPIATLSGWMPNSQGPPAAPCLANVAEL